MATVVALVLLVAVGAWVAAGVRVPGPDRALVVTARRQRVVTDRRAWAPAGLSRIRRVPLAVSVLQLDVDVRCAGAVALTVGLDVTWWVGTTPAEILAAARLPGPLRRQQRHRRPGPASPEPAARLVERAVTGALRDVLAGVGAPELLAAVAPLAGGPVGDGGPRRRVATAVFEAAGADVAAFGLRVGPVHLAAVTDRAGVVDDIERPARARIGARSRTETAEIDRRTVEAEQAALAAASRARRDAEVTRAGHDADVDRAGAAARHAGLLEAARLRQRLAEGKGSDPSGGTGPQPGVGTGPAC